MKLNRLKKNLICLISLLFVFSSPSWANCTEALELLELDINESREGFAIGIDYIYAAGDVIKDIGLNLNDSQGRVIGPNLGDVFVLAGNNTTNDAQSLKDRKDSIDNQLGQSLENLKDCINKEGL